MKKTPFLDPSQNLIGGQVLRRTEKSNFGYLRLALALSEDISICVLGADPDSDVVVVTNLGVRLGEGEVGNCVLLVGRPAWLKPYKSFTVSTLFHL